MDGWQLYGLYAAERLLVMSRQRLDGHYMGLATKRSLTISRLWMDGNYMGLFAAQHSLITPRLYIEGHFMGLFFKAGWKANMRECS
jgi:hypothetical protein